MDFDEPTYVKDVQAHASGSNLSFNPIEEGATLRLFSSTVLDTCKASNSFSLARQTCNLELDLELKLCVATFIVYSFSNNPQPRLLKRHLSWLGRSVLISGKMTVRGYGRILHRLKVTKFFHAIHH
jgi:hypothetical protein